eukprot:TRINITY_DN4961_c0_g1_i2.p1 TRINITY_DN4961_c0_g1~~TRINITY_DN4961_c0_g1_i2.p1  ORF type:complete len:229 (+),score=20.16 TRINITY_DN4961_c0_g1_i2:124-810(+)
MSLISFTQKGRSREAEIFHNAIQRSDKSGLFTAASRYMNSQRRPVWILVPSTLIISSLLFLLCFSFMFTVVPSYTRLPSGRKNLRAGSATVARVSSSNGNIDKRGWLVNPITAASNAGLRGGAISCLSVHVGEIKPHGVRGNHRHRNCNETFVIWGAKTIFRFEEDDEKKDYGEVLVEADEVALAVSPSQRAHALINIDEKHSTYLLGCQDAVISPGQDTDFHVWNDL